MLTSADRFSQRYAGGYRWLVLGLLVTAQFVMSMGAFAWGPLAPFLREAFNISRTQIGQIITALCVASALIGFPSGIMVDRWGCRKLMLAALALMMLSFFLLGLVDRFSGIVILVAIAGIGYGALNPISTKIIMLWFATKDRAMAMGFQLTGVTIGVACASVLLPMLTIDYGLRTSFIFISVMMLLMLLVTAAFYAETRENPDAENPGKSRPISKMLLKRALFRPEMLTILVLLPLMCSNQLITSTFSVLYLTEALKTPMGAASSCLAVIMVSGAVGRLAWGLISDRVFSGNRLKPLILLSLIGGICVTCLSMLPQKASLYLCLALSAGMGITFMGWNGLVVTYIAELAGKAIAATVAGIALSIGLAGSLPGPILFGYLADHFGYFAGWMLMAGGSFTVVCGLLYLQIRSSGKTKGTESINDPTFRQTDRERLKLSGTCCDTKGRNASDMY